jgi:hypothetical protein
MGQPLAAASAKRPPNCLLFIVLPAWFVAMGTHDNGQRRSIQTLNFSP